MSPQLPPKVIEQIKNAGLPTGGSHPFVPRLAKNRKRETIIDKKMISQGKKRGKIGFVDVHGHIWLKDGAHAGLPDHWDVQLQGGEDYFRIDMGGNPIP